MYGVETGGGTGGTSSIQNDWQEYLATIYSNSVFKIKGGNMWNPLAWFKAGDKAADTLKDTASDLRSAFDLLILTEEEKIQYTQKGAEQILDFQRLNQEQNSERSKARREIAWLIVNTQISLLFIIGLLWRIDEKWAEFWMKLNVEMKIGWAFVAIIIFYFGYYGATKIAEKIHPK